jgi:hypothetical protein
VAIIDVNISSVSRRDDGDTRGCVLSMWIAYLSYFKFLTSYFIFYFWCLLIWFWNMKNTEKSITWLTDDQWSKTLEMLLWLDVDPYNYDDIIDNSWSFKIRNRGKDNEYIQFSTFSIRLSYLRKYFQELSFHSNDEVVRRYNFYYKFYSVCEYTISLI